MVVLALSTLTWYWPSLMALSKWASAMVYLKTEETNSIIVSKLDRVGTTWFFTFQLQRGWPNHVGIWHRYHSQIAWSPLLIAMKKSLALTLLSWGIVINIPITSDSFQTFKVGRKSIGVMAILRVLLNEGFSTEVAVTVKMTFMKSFGESLLSCSVNVTKLGSLTVQLTSLLFRSWCQVNLQVLALDQLGVKWPATVVFIATALVTSFLSVQVLLMDR